MTRRYSGDRQFQQVVWVPQTLNTDFRRCYDFEVPVCNVQSRPLAYCKLLAIAESRGLSRRIILMTTEDVLSYRETPVRRSWGLRGLRGGNFIDQPTRLKVCKRIECKSRDDHFDYDSCNRWSRDSTRKRVAK
jgi:hypothetical protein